MWSTPFYWVNEIHPLAFKFISKVDENYVVFTSLKNNRYNYKIGEFPSKLVAEIITTVLIKHDWNPLAFQFDKIYEFNGDSYIFNYIDNQIVLESFSHEDEEELEDSPYGEFILFDGEKYNVIKKILGNKFTFGSFSTHEEALVVRNVLNRQKWGMKSFKKENIFLINNEYHVFVFNNHKIKCIGKFEDKESAVDCLDDFKNGNNAKLDVTTSKTQSTLFSSSFGCDIKTDDGNVVNFGTFPSRQLADFVKEKLLENNCDVNYFKKRIFNFEGEDILFSVKKDKISLDAKFLVLDDAKNINGISIDNNVFNIYVNGNKIQSFKSKNIAMIVRDILKENKWDLEKLKGKHVHKHNGKFYAFKFGKKQISLLGLFKSEEDALNKNEKVSDDLKSFKSIHIEQFYDNFVLYGDDKQLCRLKSKSIITFLGRILKDNGGDISYFDKNNIFLMDGEYYVFKGKKSTIKYLGTFKNLDDALKLKDVNSKVIERDDTKLSIIMNKL